MKKIMIAAFAVAFAAVAQAASIKWTATWAVDAQANDLSAGAQAYLLTTAYAIADATVAFAEGKFDASNAITSAVTAYNDDYGAHLSIDGIEADLTGTHEFYMVLLNGTAEDATQFMVVDPISVTMKDVGAAQVAFGDLSDGDTFESLYAWQSIEKGSSVPEPTSGLLIALGMAALALKRKIA